MSETNGYSREFKLDAVRRMEDCSSVGALAMELGVPRKRLYKWRERVRAGGEAAILGRPGRPPGKGNKPATMPETLVNAQQKRIAELERQLGVKQLEVDFFKRTFEHVRGAIQNPGASGGGESTDPSKHRSRSKAKH